ncbi:MAG: methionine synthase [Euryarchaeota archaeon RBG_13_61_15]|nr:MAG: methionine synthase [Euryarchaeota archaeon RBG_13_61_15]
MRVKILAASIGNCVHVAGVHAFLDLARANGFETTYIGPGVPIQRLVSAIREQNPDLVALSYRLTPQSAQTLFGELKQEFAQDPSLRNRRFFFGGTPPVAEVATGSGLFEAVFDGSEPAEAVVSALKGLSAGGPIEKHIDDLVGRVQAASPVPLIRHHFGLPSLQETLEGARKIAQRGALDILSLAPDQNAQESFFKPEAMSSGLDGAGGVPVRKPDDLRGLFETTRCGNHPLLRCYSGTNDLIKWAEMLRETVNIAWGAVPLMWYSELDGRSKRPLRDAIAENQEAIRWYADKGIPVEVNESHQWALRRCGDTIELATAYIAAYNARKLGVKDYVCQFMFDTPKGISPSMDIAKMLAKLELVESLANGSFTVLRMVRTGLSSMSTDPNIAKGQMASSVFSAMTLRPHIVHVVGFSEADHAATADEVIESCEIARGAVHKALLGMPRPEHDPAVSARKAQLLDEARFLIDAVKRVGTTHPHDPLLSPDVLTAAVRGGLLDASDLRGGTVARGGVVTRIVGGACVIVDGASEAPIAEKDRVNKLAMSEDDLDMAEM